MVVEIEKNTGKKIVPSQYGLPSRTDLRQKSENRLTLCIYRKSRIIMKDGLNVIAKAEKIRLKAPKMEIEVETTAPVCSKTKLLLLENNIRIVTV